ncbi:MAG: hydroxyacylglutathione hydrolase [Gammaproteobacteria bacterium]|nr:hydroxyacylglutathione hydrolase [Gammaproteobacteria bacterium]MDH5734962.1 hydroxyacylglutathione hydrolase [Gammaproteobacteria bacterium]
MLNIIPIPAFSDNYIWMLQRDNLKQVVLVDPGDEGKVIAFLQQHALQPVAILITHQHYDHTGGVARLVKQYPEIKLFCQNTAVSEKPLSIDLPVADFITHPVVDGDTVDINELDIHFKVMTIPGHTLDHVAYFGEGVLFCGDTIFGCGCGRLFSGTAEQMTASMERLSVLPATTRVYTAHEYTLDNIGFARWVEPDNADLIQRDQEDMAKQEKGIPTVPSLLGTELKTNPFMRYKIPQVKQAAEQYMGHSLHTDAEVFAAIRLWKDKEYD